MIEIAFKQFLFKSASLCLFILGFATICLGHEQIPILSDSNMTQEIPERIVIFPLESESNALKNQSEDVEIEINDKEELTAPPTPTFSAAQLRRESQKLIRLKRILNDARPSAYKKMLDEQILIPQSIDNEYLLERVLDLSPENQNFFFAKKERWLNRIARGLRMLHIKTSRINQAIDSVNNFIFKNALLFVKSSRTRIGIGPSANIGFGLNDPTLDWIQRRFALENMPPIRGFYLMTSFGLSMEVAKIQGRTKIRFSGFNLENRWSTKIYGPFINAGVGIFAQLYWSNDSADAPVENGTFFHPGLVNADQGENEYGATLRLQVLFGPLGGGVAALFSGKYKRFNFSPSNVGPMISEAKSYLGGIAHQSCGWSLRPERLAKDSTKEKKP